MAWPKGQPRKKPIEFIESDSAPAAPAKPEKKAMTMKAGNNWESMTESNESADRFGLRKEDWPPGFAIQFITYEVYGKAETRRLTGFHQSGWTPVHQDDFDGWAATVGFTGDDSGYIRLDGQEMVALPLPLYEKAKARDNARAKEQIQRKEQALTGGEMNATGADHPSAKGFNKIGRSVERIEIPKD